MTSPFELLHAAVQHHVVNSLGWRNLRPLQEAAIEPLSRGEHALLLAPTAGGKTEAAFLPLLSRMLTEQWQGLSLLYVCPIKALLNNLHARLERYCGYVGRRAELWHGDVGDSARGRIRREPPDVLLTTPESIEVLLTSRRTDRKAFFAGVRALVVDELHAFAGDDRGWHLLSVVERVQRIAGRTLQRVGLSATIGNPDALLDWLAGHVDGPRRVIAPPAEGGQQPEVRLDHVGSLQNAATVISRLHRGEKRLVFVDSRSRVEQLTHELRERGVSTFVSHSSLSLDERRRAEDAFAQGSDCVIVATSTLELGIDVGDLDRVIQIDAPASVASFLQRLGRTGRRAGTQRNCLFLTTSDDGFLRAIGLLDLWGRGYVEPIEPPPVPYHLFAQQVMALALQEQGLRRDGWREWIGKVPCFAAMDPADCEAIVAHMLQAGILAEDQGILWFGPEGENRFGRKNWLELFSVFTTPPLFTVLHGRSDLGQVHESTFLSTKRDEPTILLLGGRSWRVTHLDWSGRTAHVEPAKERGRSRWSGSSVALSFAHCRAIRSVLAGHEPRVLLTQRGKDQLAQARVEFPWVDEKGTVVVHAAAGDTRWWTFAGLRANAALATLLHGSTEAVGAPDNLSEPLHRETTGDDVHRALAGATAVTSPTTRESLPADIKFSTCLPAALVARLASVRAADQLAIDVVAREPVRDVR